MNQENTEDNRLNRKFLRLLTYSPELTILTRENLGLDAFFKIARKVSEELLVGYITETHRTNCAVHSYSNLSLWEENLPLINNQGAPEKPYSAFIQAEADSSSIELALKDFHIGFEKKGELYITQTYDLGKVENKRALGKCLLF